MKSAAAILPSKGSPLGFASWAREMSAVAAATANPPPFPVEALPRSDGHAVFFVPGFLAGDWTMDRLRLFVSGLGYRAETAHVAFNPGPTPGLLAKLDAALLRLADDRGRISIIGQSLGGILARELAKKHPHAVRRVITLCSPIRFPVTTPLAPMARLLAPFHDAAAIADPALFYAPPPVPLTAIYSEDDGIVDWRQCLQDDAPQCENIHVAGGHTTMGSNPLAQIVIAHALAKSR
jgi:pimeloyl-ACP methyl ester carboxylesterase